MDSDTSIRWNDFEDDNTGAKRRRQKSRQKSKRKLKHKSKRSSRHNAEFAAQVQRDRDRNRDRNRNGNPRHSQQRQSHRHTKSHTHSQRRGRPANIDDSVQTRHSSQSRHYNNSKPSLFGGRVGSHGVGGAGGFGVGGGGGFGFGGGGGLSVGGLSHRRQKPRHQHFQQNNYQRSRAAQQPHPQLQSNVIVSASPSPPVTQATSPSPPLAVQMNMYQNGMQPPMPRDKQARERHRLDSLFGQGQVQGPLPQVESSNNTNEIFRARRRELVPLFPAPTNHDPVNDWVVQNSNNSNNKQTFQMPKCDIHKLRRETEQDSNYKKTNRKLDKMRKDQAKEKQYVRDQFKKMEKYTNRTVKAAVKEGGDNVVSRIADLINNNNRNNSVKIPAQNKDNEKRGLFWMDCDVKQERIDDILVQKNNQKKLWYIAQSVNNNWLLRVGENEKIFFPLSEVGSVSTADLRLHKVLEESHIFEFENHRNVQRNESYSAEFRNHFKGCSLVWLDGDYSYRVGRMIEDVFVYDLNPILDTTDDWLIRTLDREDTVRYALGYNRDDGKGTLCICEDRIQNQATQMVYVGFIWKRKKTENEREE